MLDFITDIILIGKKLRNKIIYDIYDNINYNDFIQCIHYKKMQDKNFLSKNIKKEKECL